MQPNFPVNILLKLVKTAYSLTEKMNLAWQKTSCLCQIIRVFLSPFLFCLYFCSGFIFAFQIFRLLICIGFLHLVAQCGCISTFAFTFCFCFHVSNHVFVLKDVRYYYLMIMYTWPCKNFYSMPKAVSH